MMITKGKHYREILAVLARRGITKPAIKRPPSSFAVRSKELGTTFIKWPTVIDFGKVG
jgi:hypothetical protein